MICMYTFQIFSFSNISDALYRVNRGESSISACAINSPSTSCITDPIIKIFFSHLPNNDLHNNNFRNNNSRNNNFHNNLPNDNLHNYNLHNNQLHQITIQAHRLQIYILVTNLLHHINILLHQIMILCPSASFTVHHICLPKHKKGSLYAMFLQSFLKHEQQKYGRSTLTVFYGIEKGLYFAQRTKFVISILSNQILHLKSQRM